jgi:hypothetical protein
MDVPTLATITALATPLGITLCRTDDERIELHSWHTGGMATFADDDTGRALAISWINADQRLLTFVKSLNAGFEHVL